MIAADVVVVGGGMAGAIAALAASDRGARVVLVRRAPGATALSSGAIGVAPAAGAGPDDPLASRPGPLDAARRLAASPAHPYAVVAGALAALPDALAFAGAALAEVLAPPTGRSAFLASPYGNAVCCALWQRSMAAGDLATARGPLAVVGLRGHIGWDAALVAHGVRRLVRLGAPEPFPVEIDAFMRASDAVSRPHELARTLEAPGVAEEVGARLRAAVGGRAAAALFPPVLGLDPAARVADRISGAAGLPVAETVADVPSVPGLRLHAAIERRLAAAGVTVLTGTISGPGPGRPAGAGDDEVLASRWILASGRFIGGGVVRRGRLLEAVLGLPVQASESGASGFDLAARPAATLTSRDRCAPQPLLAAGVKVDRELRPVDTRGAPVHPDLYAAGAVIGGHDHAADGAGLGVAILTGFLAGRAAAR